MTDETRRRVLARFQPAYPAVKADHITHRFGVDDFEDLHWADRIEIIGLADDGHGIQALLVRVDGETERPDGGHYHITLSLDPNKLIPPFLRDDEGPIPYEAKHANPLIRHLLTRGDGQVQVKWLDEPFVITAMPALIKQKGDNDRVIDILPKKPGSGYKPWGAKSTLP
jgi:hypothetical protein